MKKFDFILILDFGSQYTQLIARRTREFRVYSEIHAYALDIENYIKTKPDLNLSGIILSGGPASVFDVNSPKLSDKNFEFIEKRKIPILGICYGLQLLAQRYGGKIHKSIIREYGDTRISKKVDSILLSNIKKELKVWMSHADSISKMPSDFKITSKSRNGTISSFENPGINIFALQFHPEVNHTQNGELIIENFIFKICKVKNFFKPESFINKKIAEIRKTVGKDYVICALSGGVDSSVATVLMKRAIGKQLICVHIDNGLMRKNESAEIIELFKNNFDINLIFIDASETFLRKLEGVTDPERKRKIIGKTFIYIFEREAKKIKSKNGKIKYLVQGTLYPDVIESVSYKGPSATIKSHHNVGGLPAKMNLKLIEPFRELFKDEVRIIGRKLGLPKYIIGRHPFPGPGLAVRILSNITTDKLNILKDADEIFTSELKKHNLYDHIWQAFAVLLPVQTVGVMGDERSYENVIALRAVTSKDGMTADFYSFEKEFLSIVSNKIINSIKGVNRVVYDISSKPPATIEWE